MRLAAALSALLLAAAEAAPPTDCPPLGRMPGYAAGDAPVTRAYQSLAFTTKEGDEERTVDVAGRSCQQAYTPEPGTDPRSDLEIQENYRARLRQLGARILYEADRETDAVLVAHGTETWLKIYSQETEVDTQVVQREARRQTLLPPSGKDYRLIGHMPGYAAAEPERRSYDRLSFPVQEGDETKEVEVRGARYAVSYQPAPGAAPASDLDIQENYREALRGLGAQILFADGRTTTARLENGGQTIWIKVYSQETEIEIAVIEEKGFIPSLQPPREEALKAALDRDGHAALDIPFDFDRATLRPEAAPIVAQVTRLLKDNPALTLTVEGHTDDIGGRDHNLRLSDARARAVVQALSAAGIAASRLHPVGQGPDRPIADNATPEGRAKNRRVELIRG